jgi:DNA-binding IclR family transcriptional regulator
VATTNGQQRGIQSVEVAMQALEAIERLGRAASLSTVATEAGLASSTTHRYLVSLTRVGLVAQDATTGRYDLGPAARRLGIEAIRRSDDINLASSTAGAVRNETGHTVNVSVWGDGGATVVRWEHGRYPLPIMARVGSTLPLADSSVGRVFLAYLPTSTTQSVLRDQQHGQPAWPGSDTLIEDLAVVRDRGVAKTVGGVIPGLIVLAAPVFGPGDVLTIVLGAFVPSAMGTSSVLASVEKHLVAATKALSADLGGSPAAGRRSATDGTQADPPRTQATDHSSPQSTGPDNLAR